MAVTHVQRKVKGLRFESPEEAQRYIDRGEENCADTRIHGTTKRQVAAMFAEEKPHLLPLPVEPFRYYQFGNRTVHLDGSVEVDGAYYHLPPGHIGRRLSVQWDGLHVRILDPKTGKTRVRMLDTGTGSFATALALQTRLSPADLDDAQMGKKVAAASKLDLAALKKRFA